MKIAIAKSVGEQEEHDRTHADMALRQVLEKGRKISDSDYQELDSNPKSNEVVQNSNLIGRLEDSRLVEQKSITNTVILSSFLLKEKPLNEEDHTKRTGKNFNMMQEM